jgi:hypothetical protein
MRHQWNRAGSRRYAGIVVVLLAASAVAGDPVHVAVDGEDGNPGTEAQPVATVRKALGLVWDNTEPSEIIIHRGVYPGDVTVGGNDDRLGGPRPRLLIRAAENAETGTHEEVIFEGGRGIDQAEAVPGKPGVFNTPAQLSYRYRPHMWELDTRKRYSLVADLAAVERFPASFWFNESQVSFHTSDDRPPGAHEMWMSHRRAGITLWRPNVTVKGLQFRDFLAWRWSSGVELRGPDTAAEDCRVWNCVRGYQIVMEPAGTRILRCRADDVAGGVYSQGKRALVEDCELYKIRDDFMVPSYPQDDCAIQFYYPAFGGEVRRNLCVGFGSGIFVKCPTSEFVVEHNTCLDGLQHGIGCTSWHPNSIFRYNIVTGFVWPILGHTQLNPTNVVDYNCLWGTRERSALKACLEEPRKVGTGTHTIFADPRFAAPIAGDYRLLPDSPCARMGPNGETCGALGVIGPDFEDVQPPKVSVSAAEPAQRAGGTGELYFERDPWLGGGLNLIRQLPPEGREDEWVTPQREVTLQINAQDYVSGPDLVKVRVGDGDWGDAEPFQPRKTVALREDLELSSVGVSVSDLAGNWSEPTTLLFRLATRGPRLKMPPILYANANGVVISFETDTPCLARVEFGRDASYGASFAQPKGVQRTWVSGDGGDWVEIRSRPRVTNYLVLLPPQVEPGQTYHYRLVLEDEVGNQTVTEDGSFALKGEAKSYFVAPAGTDAHGRGSRGAPWRTIQFAVDRALPGDRIVLLPGLYAGETTLSHGGIEGEPVTIEAEQPGLAVLDGRHEAKACLRLEKAPYVVIKGVEARWFTAAGIYIADSPNVSVLNCKMWNDFWMGWPIGSGVFAHRSPSFIGDHNLIFAVERGIQLLQSPQARITYNTILKNMYGAVQFVYSAAGSVSRNNCFAFSGNDQYLLVTERDDELGTFDSDYNNLGTMLRRPEPGDEIIPEEPILKVGSKAVISLNGERYNSLRAWQEATGKDLHSVFEHPQFVDPEGWDFHLQPESPNIGAGENGATIGAFGVKPMLEG